MSCSTDGYSFRATGLMSRAAIQAALDHVHAEAQREEMPYAVVLLDVDQFKAVNDQYGHPAGDSILVQVGACLRKAVRGGDWAGRWGGEEFLLLLPGTEVDEGSTGRRARASGLRRPLS